MSENKEKSKGLRQFLKSDAFFVPALFSTISGVGAELAFFGAQGDVTDFPAFLHQLATFQVVPPIVALIGLGLGIVTERSVALVGKLRRARRTSAASL